MYLTDEEKKILAELEKSGQPEEEEELSEEDKAIAEMLKKIQRRLGLHRADRR